MGRLFEYAGALKVFVGGVVDHLGFVDGYQRLPWVKPGQRDIHCERPDAFDKKL